MLFFYSLMTKNHDFTLLTPKSYFHGDTFVKVILIALRCAFVILCKNVCCSWANNPCSIVPQRRMIIHKTTFLARINFWSNTFMYFMPRRSVKKRENGRLPFDISRNFLPFMRAVGFWIFYRYLSPCWKD